MALRRQAYIVAGALVALALAACSSSSKPTTQPSSTASLSPTATRTTSSPTSPTSVPASASTLPSTSTSQPNPPPRQVLGLHARTGGGSGEVLLTWTQSAEPDVVSYVVLRAVSSGGLLAQIGTMTRQEVTQFPIRPFVDSQAQVGYYRVRAVDAVDQQGPLSAEVCGAAPGYHC